jgi:hypothetical protein
MPIKNKQILVNSPFNLNNQPLINVADPIDQNDATNLKTLNTLAGTIGTLTLLNNSYEEITIGSSLEDRLIIIDYIIERNGAFEEGTIRILNTDTNLLHTHTNFKTVAQSVLLLKVQYFIPTVA